MKNPLGTGKFFTQTNLQQIFPILLIWILIFVPGCVQQEEEVPGAEKKTLFILADGISADVLEMIHTPNIDTIGRKGGYTRAYLGGEAGTYSESPTVSAVGYNHLLTGTWSNKHNVWGNDIEDPNYNYWSIFRLMEETFPGKKSAIYSSWLDNRTKLVGDGLSEAGNITIDIHYDGFEQDTAAFPHDEEGAYIQSIDNHVSVSAARSIREEGPDLSWVYLWYTDTAGHRFGDSPPYYEAIREVDNQIGRIWEAVQYRSNHYGEDWLVFITTDHGRRLPEGKHHGEQSERERTIWIVTNSMDTNRYFSAEKPAIVDIYPTINRHMNLTLPLSLERELDGVPLTGGVSISSPKAVLNENNHRLSLSWKAWQEEGNVEIWISTGNQFARGEEENYERAGEFPLIDQQAEVDLRSYSSGYYKVVLEGPDNIVNTWVLKEDS